MVWYLLALTSAFAGSLKDLVSKKTLPTSDEYVVTWALRFYALPVLLPLMFYHEIPEVGWFYWGLLTGVVGLKTLIIILYMRAIKISELSLVSPLVTFTPLFLLFTSPIIIGEYADLWGILGVVLIVAGTYMLNLRFRKESLLKPIKAVLKDRGAQIMLVVTLLWSITSAIDKIGVQEASPYFWSGTTYIGSALLMFPVMYFKSSQPVSTHLFKSKKLLLIGLFAGVTHITHMVAIQFALVAYVISVKRLSAAFNVVYGYFVFGEQQFVNRLIGSIIMILGALLITL